MLHIYIILVFIRLSEATKIYIFIQIVVYILYNNHNGKLLIHFEALKVLVILIKSIGIFFYVLFCCRVLFVEVLQTNKTFMRELTVVDSGWLEELAPHFFQRTSIESY